MGGPMCKQCVLPIVAQPVILSLLAVGAILNAPALTLGAQRPNVLFIVSDDMNNHLGCYGYPAVQSPNIDRLASRGMRFDHAYCQVPLCNPSRVSYLSGLRPARTGVYTLGKPTRADLGDWVMLPEYFRKNGYFTVQAGKIYHTGEGHEDPRSWDVEDREFGKRPNVEEILRTDNPPGPIKHTNDWAELKTPDEKTPDGIQARRGAAHIEQAAAEGKPFFVAVGFRRPHAPFAAPKAYFDLYPPAQIALPQEPPEGYLQRLLPAALNYGINPTPQTEQQRRELIAAYYACNSFVDAQVGVVLEILDRLSLWDDTIVVFFGDQGYHLGDHGGLWHKNSLFEESCRVPLVIWAPGMKAAGKPCGRIVELIDLYPTLASLCGLPIPTDLDGIDLSQLLDEPSRPSKEAAFSAIARTDDPAERVVQIGFLGRTVRTERWRYTEWDTGRKGIELYDVAHDPHEWQNLADLPEHAATCTRLHELLAKTDSSE